MVRLRQLTFKAMHAGTKEFDLPIVLTGTVEQVKVYAEERGFKWRNSRNHLFGGWWYKEVGTDGEPESLLLT